MARPSFPSWEYFLVRPKLLVCLVAEDGGRCASVYLHPQLFTVDLHGYHEWSGL